MTDITTPKGWAARQIALDRERTARFPQLGERKQGRMSVSPFAFLRGSAPLFYELLAARPELADGPGGEGWLVGDLHLENFGAFGPARTQGAVSEKRAATFNLNDFDEAVRGPFRWDVLRLLTSLILAGRELGASGTAVLELATHLLDGYVASAFDSAPLPSPPAPVTTLIERVQSRSREELLDARTEAHAGKRHFLRGDRYRDLSPDVLAAVPAALARYAERVHADERPRPEQLVMIDAAHRIAGTGSLGVLRVAVLTSGKGGGDGGWIFDLKEQPASSAAHLLGPQTLTPADAAVAAFQACLEAPPRMLATTEIAGVGMVGRRLTPQEDKLSLGKIARDQLGPLAHYLGALVGRAHARGATKPSPSWTPQERTAHLGRAVTLAGLHEAIYLEWSFALSSMHAR